MKSPFPSTSTFFGVLAWVAAAAAAAASSSSSSSSCPITLKLNFPKTVQAGNQLHASLIVKNGGSSSIDAADINLNLPSGLTYVSATPEPDNEDNGKTDPLWESVGPISKGKSKKFKLVLGVDKCAAVISPLGISLSVTYGEDCEEEVSKEIQVKANKKYFCPSSTSSPSALPTSSPSALPTNLSTTGSPTQSPTPLPITCIPVGGSCAGGSTNCCSTAVCNAGFCQIVAVSCGGTGASCSFGCCPGYPCASDNTCQQI